MQSGGARTATAVIVVTMVFAPVAQKNGWLYKLVGEEQSTEMVQCAPGDACPEEKTVYEKVFLPTPDTAELATTGTPRVGGQPTSAKPKASPKAKPKPKAPTKAKKPLARPALTVILTPGKRK